MRTRVNTSAAMPRRGRRAPGAVPGAAPCRARSCAGRRAPCGSRIPMLVDGERDHAPTSGGDERQEREQAEQERVGLGDSARPRARSRASGSCRPAGRDRRVDGGADLARDGRRVDRRSHEPRGRQHFALQQRHVNLRQAPGPDVAGRRNDPDDGDPVGALVAGDALPERIGAGPVCRAIVWLTMATSSAALSLGENGRPATSGSAIAK